MRILIPLIITFIFVGCQKDNSPKVAPPPKSTNTLIGYWQREHTASCGEDEILLFTEARIGWVPLQENTCTLAYPKIIEYTYTTTEVGKLSVEGMSSPWEYSFRNGQLSLKKTATDAAYSYRRITAEDYEIFIKAHQRKP
ncbi:MAG: hypothetical protein ACFNP4_04840 [Capnocytophaga gingivalis]|uniref:hypothetical protein n=1 Tax=Capnocytophaga gingivalis TaxID=1017 RepID=UPI00361A7481